MKYAVIVFLISFLISEQSKAQLTNNELFVEYDSAWTFRNLQVIPIRFKGGAGIGFSAKHSSALISLSTAIKKHKVKLQEMPYENGADVNWLQITNHSKQKVIVQSGEIISGGKQDRMIGETKIVEPGKTDYLHVFCIEKKRWDDKAKSFMPGGVANSELRKTMDIAGRQSEVWKEIDRQFLKTKKSSETAAYLDLYKDSLQTDTAYTNYFLQKYARTDSSFAGYIFITGNRIISCELFASAEFANMCFYNMLSSYILTVQKGGSQPEVTKRVLQDFMNKVIATEKGQKAFVTTHGKLHVVDGKVVHLIAYGE